MSLAPQEDILNKSWPEEFHTEIKRVKENKVEQWQGGSFQNY